MAKKQKPSLKKHSVAALKRMKGESEGVALTAINEGRRISAEIDRRAFEKANIIRYLGKVFRSGDEYVIPVRPFKTVANIECATVWYSDGDVYLSKGSRYSVRSLEKMTRVSMEGFRRIIRARVKKQVARILDLLKG